MAKTKKRFQSPNQISEFSSNLIYYNLPSDLFSPTSDATFLLVLAWYKDQIAAISSYNVSES